MKAAQQTTPEIPAVDLGSQLNEFRKAEDWPAMFALTSDLVLRPEPDDQVLVAHLEALSNLNQHEEALEFTHARGLTTPGNIAGPELSAANFELAKRVGSLLCEVGDFSSVIEFLRPLTTPPDSASHEVLNLRGWAHQNSFDETHAEEGIECYRAALNDVERSETSQDGSNSAASKQEDRDGLRLWYHKGLANALRRLHDRQADARAAYQAVIDEARSIYVQRPSYSAAIRIEAWCYNRIGEFQKAFEAYKRALDSGVSRFSTQLDSALNLLSMGRTFAAVQQYRSSILDLMELPPLQRAGILRVSLFELCDALLSNSNLRSKEARGLVEELYSELEKALALFRPALHDIAERVRIAATEIKNSVGGDFSRSDLLDRPSASVINWRATQIIGFTYSRWTPCALFRPVVTVEGAAEGKRFVLDSCQEEHGEESASITLGPLDPSASVCAIEFKQQSSPTSRIIFIADDFYKITDSLQLKHYSEETLDWKRVSGAICGFAACISLEKGTLLLNRISRELSAQVICGLTDSGDPSQLRGRAWMAVQTATNDIALYLAVLCLINAGGTLAEIITWRDGPLPGSLPSADALQAAADRFRQTVKLLGPKPLKSCEPGNFAEAVAKILESAEETGNISDEAQRGLDAMFKAAEMQACVPDGPEVRAIQQRLAEKLSRSNVLYLDLDEETLVLSREPAFFCSLASPRLSKPALDTFTFFNSSSRYKAFSDGPIASQAKSAVSRAIGEGRPDLVDACGGFSSTIHAIVSVSRGLWRLLVQDEQNAAGRKPEEYRRTSVEMLMAEYQKISTGVSRPEAFHAVVDHMLKADICRQDSKDAKVIKYRRSALNALDLCRILLSGVRPDHDLRYFVWRDLRRYYGFVQSREIAHHIHALSTALNDLLANRREAVLLQGGPPKGISWSLHEDILPEINRRIGQNFAIPLKMSEFFLECCRFVNYIQLSADIGRVDLRAVEIDAEYLLSQLFGIPTGIKGLDDLFGGGGLMLVEADTNSAPSQLGGRSVLVIGPFGSGKSLFTLQMAVEVARKGGAAWIMAMEQSAEECLYSLEAMGCLPDDAPIRIADSVPKAIEVLENREEDKGALILVRTVKDRFDDFALTFEQNARLMGGYPLRFIAVDPVSAISRVSRHDVDLRAQILDLFDAVKRQGTNVWLVTEEDSAPESIVEQKVADTVIRVHKENTLGYSQRYIEVTKSRLQREHRGLHAFAIGPGRGITVYPSPPAVRSWIRKRSTRVPDTPISFGVPDIDSLLGSDGLYAGDTIVLQGEPGTGKTVVTLAFLLSADLARSEKKAATTMLLTSAEAEVSARYKLQSVYETLRRKTEFVRQPHRVRIVGIPGGYVKPGFILQQIKDQFENARITGNPIVRVAVESIRSWDLGCPFVQADETFGETLVEVLRKHRVTSLFLCSGTAGRRDSVLQEAIVNAADCVIDFHVLPVRSTPERHIEIKKTRTMHHRRGIFRFNLDTLQAGATTTLMRMVRPGEFRPIKIRLFLRSESAMQASYNQSILMAVRGVLSRDAHIAEELPIHLNRALALGSASALDELQVIQLDEHQVPSVTDGTSGLHRFEIREWSNAEWDDFLPAVRGRVQTGNTFIAVPFFENISMLAWRGNLNAASRDSWAALAERCQAWEKEHPNKDDLFFDFPAVTGENYNCLFFEILLSLTPIPRGTDPSCAFRTWLGSDAAIEASFLFRRLCHRAYMRRDEGIQRAQLKGLRFSPDKKAQVWRHWYTTLNQMLADMPPDERASIHVGALPKSVTIAGEWYLGVPAYSAAPDVALKLIKLFTTHEAESDRLRLGVGLPTRQSFYKSTSARSSISPLFAMDSSVLRGLIKNAFRRSAVGCYSKFSTLVTLYLQDLLEYSSDDAQTLRKEIRSRIDDLQRHLQAIRLDNCRLCIPLKQQPGS